MPWVHLAAMLNGLPLPSLAIDRTERIAAANDQIKALLGQNVQGRNFVTLLRQPALVEAIENTLRDGTPREAPWLSRAGGQDTTWRVDLSLVQDHVLLCFRDVTQVEKTTQMRRDFVANVSHELRTPLTSLTGFIETLQGPARNDPDARERFLGIMLDEAARMSRLIDDLLSLSRVEAQARDHPQEQVDLADILPSTVRTLQALAHASDVEVLLDMPETPLPLTADVDQLVQVFTNLIENGIKYGRTGGVLRLLVSTAQDDPNLRAPGVTIKVIDQGAGIEPHHISRLTERFYRADTHRSREMGGTGLGLAIVKHILNRHRGRLRITSQPGEGSCFTVILPLRSDPQS